MRARRTQTDDGARRVLHLVTSDAFAGIERHTLNLVREQQRQGWQAELVCPPSAHRLRGEANTAGIRVLPAEGSGSRSWLLTLVRDVRASRPTVLHVHDGRSALVGGVLSLLVGGLFVRTQHFVHTASMSRSGLARRASLALHRLVNARLDGYVAVSQSVACGASERDETGTAEVVVIPPAIDLPDDSVVIGAQEARRVRTHPVVAFTGRLEAERHLDVLLRALVTVRADLPDCRLVLAGTGAAETDLRRLAAALGIEQALTWTGWVGDTYSVLADADVYVNTWPREAFGMAMAEAMALALPVVAVDAGANSEMVADGVTGFLVPPDDADALAAALIRLLGDRPLAQQMGDAARARSLAEFGAATTAASTLALYRRLLDRGRR